MKLVLVPVLSFAIVLSAAFLLLGLRPASDNRNRGLPEPSPSSPLFVFSVFNVIIVAVLLVSHNPGAYEAGHFAFAYSSLDEEESYGSDSDKYKIEDDGYGGADADECATDPEENVDECATHFDGNVDSKGYDEDDDDSGSEGSIGWEDEEEQQENGGLEKRFEDFIDKVREGWREEKMKDNLSQV